MTWDAVGATGEWAGALVVVATLFYLAKQIRQSNKLSRFSVSRDLMNQMNELNRLVTTDSTLRLLLMKAGELSSDENEQIYNFAMMCCNVWFSVQIAYDSGQIDKGLYAAGLRDVRVEMDRRPNFRSAIQQWLDNYPENAQHEIFQSVTTRTS